ncbi:hypothetical protein EV363DRAFT_1174577 [Boletus edulis]|nr:hypothetical protein EV363DRAFT_1174577 [Boletus edulis]
MSGTWASNIAAYDKGLNGMQAAWAVKKYCGHCVLPVTTLQDFDVAAHCQSMV